jgi:hypothetical protein
MFRPTIDRLLGMDYTLDSIPAGLLCKHAKIGGFLFVLYSWKKNIPVGDWIVSMMSAACVAWILIH